MKKLISLILLLIMMTSVFGSIAYADTGIGIEAGQTMPDFTVDLTDGTTATLSDILKEKDLVILNIFASWCGPCEKEFPEMEKVYQKNRDHMEIVAVSGDPNDTMEIMSEYKSGHGLSFPIGLKGDALSSLSVSSFPTTIFIDRNGMVGFIKIGAFLSEEDFESKVSVFLSPDYDGKPLASEKAFSLLPFIFGWLVIGGLILIIGRWRIFLKAGKKGWHSLIPLLNTYQEYSTCWKGGFGILSDLCRGFGIAAASAGLSAVSYILVALGFLIDIPESLKLAKAFGKGKVFGVLMILPIFKEICRFVLGVSKAEYQPPEADNF